MENWRFGMLAATVSNVQAKKKLKPSDFYPPIARKKQSQLSPRQQQQLKAKREREKASKR